MHWQTWLAFVAACTLMGMFPGPGVASVVGYALSSGRRTALVAVGGMAIGSGMAMSLSLAGAGAILAASALAFAILKWAGAIYLISLGTIAILRSGRAAQVAVSHRRAIAPRTAFVSNLGLALFHPKMIIFYIAFVPQFIRPDSSYLGQSAILVATLVTVSAITDTCYVLAASRAAQLLKSPRAGLWSRRAGGGVLIAAGVATAATSRA